MTNIIPKTTICSICGTSNEVYEVSSTVQFGSPDLDTRPGEMERSTLGYSIFCCIKCAFCSGDLSESDRVSEDYLKSAEYVARLNDPDFPELANQFLCRALIKTKNKLWDEAGWACLMAAWVCDDEGSEKNRYCRDQAISSFINARAVNLAFAEDSLAEQTLLADISRVIGRFGEAEEFCDLVLARNPRKIIRIIVGFQKWLIASKSLEIRTIDEAIEHYEGLNLEPYHEPSTGIYYLVQIQSQDGSWNDTQFKSLFRSFSDRFERWVGERNLWLIDNSPEVDPMGPILNPDDCTEYYWISEDKARQSIEKLGGTWSGAQSPRGYSQKEFEIWKDY